MSLFPSASHIPKPGTDGNPLRQMPVAPPQQKGSDDDGRFSPTDDSAVVSGANTIDDSDVVLGIKEIFKILWASNLSYGLFGKSHHSWEFPTQSITPQHLFCRELIYSGFESGIFDAKYSARACHSAYLSSLDRKTVERIRAWIGPVQVNVATQKNLESRNATLCREVESAFYDDLAELILTYPKEEWPTLKSFLPDSVQVRIDGLKPGWNNPIQFF